MIAIYGKKSDHWVYDARDSLLSSGIPCVLFGPEVGFASMAETLPLILFPSQSDAVADSFRKSISQDRVMDALEPVTGTELVEMVKLRYFQKFGHDYEFATGSCVRFSDRRVFFRGHELCLTKTEYRIVRLLFHAQGQYFSAEEIAAACFEGSGSTVSTHASSINRKARYMTEMPLIETRRYHGYRIPTPVVSSLN